MPTMATCAFRPTVMMILLGQAFACVLGLTMADRMTSNVSAPAAGTAGDRMDKLFLTLGHLARIVA